MYACDKFSQVSCLSRSTHLRSGFHRWKRNVVMKANLQTRPAQHPFSNGIWNGFGPDWTLSWPRCCSTAWYFRTASVHSRLLSVLFQCTGRGQVSCLDPRHGLIIGSRGAMVYKVWLFISNGLRNGLVFLKGGLEVRIKWIVNIRLFIWFWVHLVKLIVKKGNVCGFGLLDSVEVRYPIGTQRGRLVLVVDEIGFENKQI